MKSLVFKTLLFYNCFYICNAFIGFYIVENSIAHQRDEYNIRREETFIERLKDKEVFTIAFSESGCFTDKTKMSSLKIKRQGSDYYISYNDKSKKISSNDFVTIKRFEIEIDSISKIYKCTNGGHYLIKYGKEIKNRIDNTCSWHGFDNLTRALLLYAA